MVIKLILANVETKEIVIKQAPTRQEIANKAFK